MTVYFCINLILGLVDTDWGGTPVEAWSSPDALAKCKKDGLEELTEYDLYPITMPLHIEFILLAQKVFLILALMTLLSYGML